MEVLEETKCGSKCGSKSKPEKQSKKTAVRCKRSKNGLNESLEQWKRVVACSGIASLEADP